MVDSFFINIAYSCCGLPFTWQKVSHREKKRFLFETGIHKYVEHYFFGDEENMKPIIYSITNKKCGDNVYGN